jgi:hypothetical protein
MDLTPDIYHRRNFVDSISRSIPYTSNKEILTKRVNYYFSLISFIKQKNIDLKLEHIHTIWSVIFYFICFYLTSHKDITLFFIDLRKAKRMLQVNWMKYVLTLGYTPLFVLSKRFYLFRGLRQLYFKIFRKHLPTQGIISQNNLGKKVINIEAYNMKS